MKNDERSRIISDAICRVGRENMPVEIVESYALAAGLEYPVSNEKELVDQLVSAAGAKELSDPDFSGTLAAIGLTLQGFPISDPTDAVEKLHARLMHLVSGRTFPIPVPPLVPDLIFGGESRRPALASSAEFDDTPCGRAAADLHASGSFNGLLSIGRLQLAVGQCKAALPAYTGRCGDAARRAFAEELIARLVAADGADPDAPLSGSPPTRLEQLATARTAAQLAADFAYALCQLPGFLSVRALFDSATEDA